MMTETTIETGKAQTLGEIEDLLAKAYQLGGNRDTRWSVVSKVCGGYEFTGDAKEFQAISVKLTS
ncbi:hypothetical protein [Mycobacteroides abscessus]|uniref:hypothetical protein n=1 Tax=Mycobacteroides abscessus TaxID=36809 RepID=UPI00092B513B|nr:hypothetical protein [Mycobacteroides abscessus]DAZ90321.1 TPA_asm: hypothetical protein PROPHIFSQJ01-1_35 [Mycobacterium phage prophiFSQJ01-1]SII40766.1 Uncharacterised protein [Mycobacteroides abscessus subsp. abscessus]SIK14451.1 Uncharacterised protein [Mycobacteroides abscessus subsp. abscessus]SIN25236.1 Uncharacterised protein [Mycobacteroides abscessus subsp. abscessus]SLI51690.1 Uncharacterised protein [Mycobacteroides abscessus subsp. abscessus]